MSNVQGQPGSLFFGLIQSGCVQMVALKDEITRTPHSIIWPGIWNLFMAGIPP